PANNFRHLRTVPARARLVCWPGVSHTAGPERFVTLMPTSAVAFHTLIVEDDPSSSDVIARAIRRVHVEPIVAMTVGQALVHIEEQWPPAVVLDLRLPDADGTVL